ncbi:MAG TPA: acyl-CoA dehydrogenase family protein [Kofleriaceae bacterium]|jgi:acyl-CoA oxidase
MSADRVADLDDPQLRAFAPLLYVAWSDFDLDASERAAVMAKMAAQPWLRPAAKLVIQAWLDTAHPPSAEELGRLRTLIDRVGSTASTRAKSSIAQAIDGIAADENAKAAAAVIASDLGIVADGSGTASPRPAGGATARPGEPPPTDHVLNVDAHERAAHIAALTAILDGAHADERSRVRQFLSTPRRAYGLPVTELRDHVRGWLHELAATGLPASAFPGATSEGDLASFTAVFEDLGHGDLSLLVKAGVHWGLYGGAVWALGTARHHARLPAIASGAELGCFAMSEVGHGSNVAGVETTATYDHATREIVVHTPGESARKEWIGGAAHDARWAVVFAQLDVGGARQGVHAVLVPIRTAAGGPIPGVRTGDSGHKMGLNGVDNGRLWFENVRVPVANMLDRFATIDADGTYASPIASPDRRFFTMLGTLIGGRVSVGAASVSAARTALAIALRYAHARRQFGSASERRLIDYPTHQRRLLPHLADTVVLRIAFQTLRARHADLIPKKDADLRELEAEAAAMKILGSRHAINAVQAAREACGGQGYLSVNRIPELRTDVDIFTTFEGDNTVLAQLVGKALLGAQRKQLAAGGTFAVLRAVGRRIATAVTEKNPVTSRRGGQAHLRDRAMHLAAFRYREDHLVETALLRIKKRIDSGLDGEAAVLAIQEHVVALADAFAEHRAAQWFATTEAALPASPARDLIARLGDLSLLARLDAHAAWFLEAEYFEVPKTRAIRKEVESLLADLAPHARDIVDAFAIPDACLAAPIAFFDPAHPTYG